MRKFAIILLAIVAFFSFHSTSLAKNPSHIPLAADSEEFEIPASLHVLNNGNIEIVRDSDKSVLKTCLFENYFAPNLEGREKNQAIKEIKKYIDGKRVVVNQNGEVFGDVELDERFNEIKRNYLEE